jgi:uncharacterized protein (DUF302 family)
MKTLLSSLLTLLLLSQPALAGGVLSIQSARDDPAPADRLEGALKAKGMTVFARIDHGGNARKVGEALRPTELLLFGNPKVGAPLMQCRQIAGIDMPQKALIGEDEQGQVRLSDNDPAILAERHGIADCGEVVQRMAKALDDVAGAATAP